MVFLTFSIAILTMIYLFGGFDDYIKRYRDIQKSKSKWKE
jgi:hypothetical protein